jgi:hypothetical protein
LVRFEWWVWILIFEKFEMANADGNTLATSGFKPRPSGRKAEREFSSTLVAILQRIL